MRVLPSHSLCVVMVVKTGNAAVVLDEGLLKCLHSVHPTATIK